MKLRQKNTKYQWIRVLWKDKQDRQIPSQTYKKGENKPYQYNQKLKDTVTTNTAKNQEDYTKLFLKHILIN